MSKELIDILTRGHESKDLDYKGPAAWDEGNKRACCELVKDILGMANTLGGYLVIGVSETAGGFLREGLTPEQADTFDTTRVNRFLQNYTDPPINTLLKKVTHENKMFVIIQVPRFADTPHICQKEFPQVLITTALYVRTDNNETAPLRSSADFRSIVEQAVRNRSDALLTAFHTVLTGGTPSPEPDVKRFEEQWKTAVVRFDEVNPLKDAGYTGYLEAAFLPGEFRVDRFTLQQLRSAAERASVNFTGWPFLAYASQREQLTYVIQDGLETLIDHKLGDDRVDFWQLRQSGFFYQRVLMWEEFYQRQRSAPPAMKIDSLVQYVTQAMYCLKRLYEGLLPDSEEVELRIRVLGTEGRKLETFDSRRLYYSYVSKMPQIEYRRGMSLAGWTAGLIDHADEASGEIFFRFNWQQPGSFRQMIENMFLRQY